MSVLKAACPSCAAPIEFQKGSTIVLICPFCRSAIARTDRGLSDLGKIAEIVDSQSPLKIGLRGEFNGNKFELTGRAQLKHELGGVWDEWYAVFSNGWVGWLAEAQGRFYLTFYKPLPSEAQLPSFVSLQLNQTITQISNDTPLMVTEKGTAKYATAEGEIPFKLTPDEPKNFADLTGKNNAFGTIDYSQNPPRVFVGRQVTLKEIGLGDAKPNVRAAASVAVGKMGCPNCGGSLELVAPDKTERVTCPFCNSLLDVNNGNLKFLKSLGEKATFSFELPIGAKGKFADFDDGAEQQIIGAMVRSVTYSGTKYFWREYLLYNPMIGFRWLVEAEHHWNYVESVTVATNDFSGPIAGDVITRTNPVGKDATALKNKNFHLFQTAPATVEYVQGEFYWRVEQGETVKSSDYIAPPFMLSMESTDKELNWSLGTYVERDTIRNAFNQPDLPASFSVAPNQPFKQNRLIRASLIVLAAFVLVTTISSSVLNKMSDRRATGTNQKFTLSPQTAADAKTVFYSAPFYLAKGKSGSVTLKTALNYETWSDFSATLVPANQAANQNNPAQIKTGDYGYPDWTSNYRSLDVAADGDYQLRVEGNWKEWDKPLNLEIDVYQYNSSGIPVTILLIFMLAGVSLILIIYKFNFETRRWSNTDLQKPSGELLSDIIAGK